jgi:hypothetical protein
MEALKSIVERFWNDVAGLPWRDKQWVNNPRLIEQTRQHYVNATYDDLSKLIEQPALKVVIKKLDEMMEQTPSRELADTSNFLQTLLNEEEADATTTSKDA